MEKTYKGHTLKPGVKIIEKIVNGEKREILECPPGCKNPYADVDNDGEKKEKRKTTKANPERDSILIKMLDTLKSFSGDGKIYKTKEGKFCVKNAEGKWFSISVTANKFEPKDKTLYEISIE